MLYPKIHQDHNLLNTGKYIKLKKSNLIEMKTLKKWQIFQASTTGLKRHLVKNINLPQATDLRYVQDQGSWLYHDPQEVWCWADKSHDEESRAQTMGWKNSYSGSRLFSVNNTRQLKVTNQIKILFIH